MFVETVSENGNGLGALHELNGLLYSFEMGRKSRERKSDRETEGPYERNNRIFGEKKKNTQFDMDNIHYAE